MDECIDSIGKIQIVSTLDANSGYWQLEMDEKDNEKNALVTHHGLFKYTRMPFGLKNATAKFQRFMNINLALVKWRHALVYTDDIINISKTQRTT